jgi:hypothetical protein
LLVTDVAVVTVVAVAPVIAVAVADASTHNQASDNWCRWVSYVNCDAHVCAVVESVMSTVMQMCVQIEQVTCSAMPTCMCDNVAFLHCPRRIQSGGGKRLPKASKKRNEANTWIQILRPNDTAQQVDAILNATRERHIHKVRELWLIVLHSQANAVPHNNR